MNDMPTAEFSEYSADGDNDNPIIKTLDKWLEFLEQQLPLWLSW